MSKSYVCAECGGTFDTDRPEAEADAEALALWGVVDAHTDSGMAEICDVCFMELTAALN